MTGRIVFYRAVCVLLGVYAVVAIALAVSGGLEARTGAAPSRILLHLVAHAFLLGMAGVRMARPAAAGTTGSLLLTLAMATAVVSGAGLRIGPAWLPNARLALLALAYIALRVFGPARPPAA